MSSTPSRPERIVVIGSTYPKNELYCPHWVGVKAGLDKLGIPYEFVSCRPTLCIKDVVRSQPDLVIYGLADMVKHPEWRAEIRARLPNARIVMWYGDYRDDQMFLPNADCSEIDTMFVSNDAQGDFYKRRWKVKKVKFCR